MAADRILSPEADGLNVHELSARLVHELAEQGLTVACAESLTGGLVAAAIVDTPGASKVFLGGVVSYGDEVKAKLLGVSETELNARGAVSEVVARQMAVGVRQVVTRGGHAAAIGLSTTGFAGPDADHGGKPGTVFVGLASPRGVTCVERYFVGGRQRVRALAVIEALALALREVEALD